MMTATTKTSELAFPASIVVTPNGDSKANSIAIDYQIATINDSRQAVTRFVLEFANDRLCLLDRHRVKSRPIVVADSKLTRLSKKQLLGKAIGRQSKFVVDATAGWGSDALLLARMGFRVVTVERSPVISALLEDGIKRNLKLNSFLKLSHRFGDAISILDALTEKPDTVYLDPMYPQGRKKSVKVARKMEILRTLAGEDSDFQELFEVAIHNCARRVVLKRPGYAEVLFPERLSMSFEGKMVRYDVYLAGN